MTRGKKVILGAALVLLAVVAAPFCICQGGPMIGAANGLYYSSRVRNGMTLKEVESVMGGPGQQHDSPPGTRDGPVVQGDEFYEWHPTGVEFWVGFRNGRVCDKWYTVPNF
jgi:hypothetical protein